MIQTPLQASASRIVTSCDLRWKTPRSRASIANTNRMNPTHVHVWPDISTSLLCGALLAAPAQPAAEFRPWQGVDDRAGFDPCAPRLKDSVASLFELRGAVGVGINRERRAR